MNRKPFRLSWTDHRVRVAAVAALLLMYALLIAPLYEAARFALVMPLALLLGFAAGWLLGMRGGMVAAAGIVLTTTLLLVGIDGLAAFSGPYFGVNAVSGLLALGLAVAGAAALQRQFATSRSIGGVFSLDAEKLRALVSDVPIIIFALDREGVFTLSEGKGLKRLGLESGEAEGKSFFEMYAHVPQLISDVRRAIAGETLTSFVQGPGLAYENFYFPLRDSHNQVTGVMALSIDVTTRREAEEAYRTLVENSLQGLLIISEEIRISFANSAIAEIVGFSVEELTDMPGEQVARLVYEADREAVLERVRAIMDEQPVPARGTARFVRKDETLRWIESYAVRTTYRNKPALQIACVDITERKQSEDRAREAERLRLELEKERELKEHKRRFISMVTHEFRTPLTIISTSAYLLQRNLGKLPPEKASEHFGKIQAQVKWLDAMVDNMLALHREEEHPAEFSPFPVDVKALCRELLAEMQAAARPNQNIVFNTPESVPTLSLDPRLLRHIITNLLSNAIKYSPGGGEIRLGLAVSEESVTFQISDQGIGISAADQVTIFDSFQRGSNVGEIRGTGLGLKIVKDYVELHSGRITVDSAIGQGTTFTIHLPRSTPQS